MPPTPRARFEFTHSTGCTLCEQPGRLEIPTATTAVGIYLSWRPLDLYRRSQTPYSSCFASYSSNSNTMKTTFNFLLVSLMLLGVIGDNQEAPVCPLFEQDAKVRDCEPNRGCSGTRRHPLFISKHNDLIFHSGMCMDSRLQRPVLPQQVCGKHRCREPPGYRQLALHVLHGSVVRFRVFHGQSCSNRHGWQKAAGATRSCLP